MKETAAIGEDALHDLGGGLADDELVSSDERDDRVRVLLDELDELGIDDDGMTIESAEFDHDCVPSREAIGGGRVNLEPGWKGEGNYHARAKEAGTGHPEIWSRRLSFRKKKQDWVKLMADRSDSKFVRSNGPCGRNGNPAGSAAGQEGERSCQ
jgi:hypothetical protein